MNHSSERFLTEALENAELLSRRYNAAEQRDFGSLFAALLALQPGGLAAERWQAHPPSRRPR